MKRILNGKIYDTDKAKPIGDYCSPLPVTDFSWWQATLYRTPRKRQYFLAGEGGPMSKYGQVYPGGVGYGFKIFPLSKQDALEWAEEHLAPKIVQSEFNDLLEEA